MGSEEQRAAQLLLAIVVVVPLTWLALGFRGGELLGGNDLSLLLVPMMRRLLAVHGDLDAFRYDPAWLGGSPLHDVLGMLPLHRVLAPLLDDAVLLLNLTVMFAQVLYGYLAARTARAFATLLDPEALVGMPATLLVAVCAAFAPVLAWRVAYGHVYLLFGALALPAACALVLLVRARQLTVTCSLGVCLAFAHALPHVGQQTVVYGAIFGLPLLVALAGEGAERTRVLVPFALACLGVFLVSLPELVSLLHYFNGSDTARGLNGRPVTYAYLVANARDWLSSLPFHYEASWSGRPLHEAHESNYPLGPVCAFALLLPRRLLKLGIALGLAALLVVTFASNVAPLSTALLAVLPPLRVFRVPGRAALCFLLAALPLFLALPLGRLPARLARRDLSFALVLGALLAGRVAFEVALWIAVLAACILALRSHPFRPSATAVLAVCALGSVLGFEARLVPFPSKEELTLAPERLGEAMRRALPELASPLARVVSDPELALNNRLYGYGLGSLSGYNLVGERFTRLYCALLGVPYQPNVALVSIDPTASYFPKVAALYDVVAHLELRRGGRLRRIDGPHASLWFAKELVRMPSVEALVAGFEPSQREAAALYAASDPDARDLPTLQCQADSAGLAYTTSPGPVLVEVQLPAARSGLCPLTMAMNYQSGFVVTGRSGRGEQALRTFPAYGALLGVLVPEGVSELRVEWPAHRPAWTYVAALLGLVSLVMLFVWQRARGMCD